MNSEAFFVCDLHGSISRYEKLFEKITREKPGILFLGGDLLPHGLKKSDRWDDFTLDFLIPEFIRLKTKMNKEYPEIFLILGNDDYRSEENKFRQAASERMFTYLNNSVHTVGKWSVFGYPFIPPTPFMLKDWEKYDVSRYVDPGCSHPTEGFRTLDPDHDPAYSTIQEDLERIGNKLDFGNTVLLLHSPPYKTLLDRAALDGKMVDHVPLDVNIGSIAIKRFIESHQPAIALHGHVHESTRLTGSWKQRIGNTRAMNAAHDGKELALIRFDLAKPDQASRELI